MSNIEAVKKYQEKRDSIMLRPSKEDGQQIRETAKAGGQSVQAYILQAVRERMERELDGAGRAPEPSAPYGGSYGLRGVESDSFDGSRFLSQAKAEKITALLSDGETVEDFIQEAIDEKITRDEAKAADNRR